DLRPPDAAMAEADAILVERFGDDDVIDFRLREIAELGQVGDAAETAGFLVRRARNLDGAGKIRIGIEESFDSDNRGGEPALHVTGTPPINPPILHHAGERIDRPAIARFDHVDMRVEMNAGTGRAAVETGDYIDARIAVAVARRSFGANEFGLKTPPFQPRGEVFGTGAIGFPWRIDGRETDQVRGQFDQFVRAPVDQFQQSLRLCLI